jgi:hypothetical protein
VVLEPVVLVRGSQWCWTLGQKSKDSTLFLEMKQSFEFKLDTLRNYKIILQFGHTSYFNWTSFVF